MSIEIDETYEKTIELYELPDKYLDIVVQYVSDNTMHEEVVAFIKLDSLLIVEGEDEVLGFLVESSNDELKAHAESIELFLRDMRKEASCSSREDAEREEYEADLAELNAEYWSSR